MLLWNTHSIQRTYLAKCRNSFFNIAFFSISTLFHPLIHSLTHSFHWLFLINFFPLCSIQFRFISNFSIYLFDNAERHEKKREKERERNLFAQCKRINRGKQYNMFHVFSLSLFIAYSLFRLDFDEQKYTSSTHIYIHIQTNQQYSWCTDNRLPILKQIRKMLGEITYFPSIHHQQ